MKIFEICCVIECDDTRSGDFATHPDSGCFRRPRRDAPAAATYPISLLSLQESIFDKIDIIERSGIFAINEILADCVTRPKNLATKRNFSRYTTRLH